MSSKNANESNSIITSTDFWEIGLLFLPQQTMGRGRGTKQRAKARSQCEEPMRGANARSQGRGNMVRSEGMEPRQGANERSQGKEPRQGAKAKGAKERSQGKEPRQGAKERSQG